MPVRVDMTIERVTKPSAVILMNVSNPSVADGRTTVRVPDLILSLSEGDGALINRAPPAPAAARIRRG